MADDLRIFPDEYVLNAEGVPYHSKWVAANKNGDAPKWVVFRDALLAGQTPVPPDMATKYGRALVAAGKEHMSIVMSAGRAITPPPGEGVLMDQFTDWYYQYGTGAHPNGDIFSNRWNTGTVPQGLAAAQVNWSSIGGPAITEATTSHGAGFKFQCDSQMVDGAGVKRTEMQDSSGNANAVPPSPVIRGEGFTDEVSFWINWPAAGNVSGFPGNTNRWNVFWQCVQNPSHLALVFGVDMQSAARKFYAAVVRNPGASTELYVAQPAWQVQLDTDYHFRYQIKWSQGGGGFFKWWINDVLVGDYTGQTMVNASIILEFGWYSAASFLTTHTISDIRVLHA